MKDKTSIVICIPAKPEVVRVSKRQLRVAAYCRVSTDDEEQLTSYEAQKNYYTDKIMTNKEWTMAGIFADEGITGTSARKRPEFLRMIRQCKQGKIDIVLTKSISRFARNTLRFCRPRCTAQSGSGSPRLNGARFVSCRSTACSSRQRRCLQPRPGPSGTGLRQAIRSIPSWPRFSAKASAALTRDSNLLHAKGAQPGGRVFNPLDLMAQIGQRGQDLVQRGAGFQVILQPGQGELHRRPLRSVYSANICWP